MFGKAASAATLLHAKGMAAVFVLLEQLLLVFVSVAPHASYPLS